MRHRRHHIFGDDVASPSTVDDAAAHQDSMRPALPPSVHPDVKAARARKAKTARQQHMFYQHLKMHPGAHQAAKHFAAKLAAKDPAAVARLKQLAATATTDEASANALRIIAVTMKFEQPGTTMISGGIPGGHVIKLALSPLAWALAQSGKLFHWSGTQFQHFSRFI